MLEASWCGGWFHHASLGVVGTGCSWPDAVVPRRVAVHWQCGFELVACFAIIFHVTKVGVACCTAKNVQGAWNPVFEKMRRGALPWEVANCKC